MIAPRLSIIAAALRCVAVFQVHSTLLSTCSANPRLEGLDRDGHDNGWHGLARFGVARLLDLRLSGWMQARWASTVAGAEAELLASA